MGHRILEGEASWDDRPFHNDGEFRYITGYWEWTEDVLSRCKPVLRDARIYEAVHASLFTYDISPNIMEAFCEAWCPITNSLHVSSGELSITLWDLANLACLPDRKSVV